MVSVGSFEAKTHLTQLLERAKHGESIVITRRGKPVAMLVPPVREEPKDIQRVVARMLAYRDERKLTLGGMTPRELIESGRRF